MFESLKEKNVFAKYEKPLWNVYQAVYFAMLIFVITVRYYETSAFNGNGFQLPYILYQTVYFISNMILPFMVAANVACILLSLLGLATGPFVWKKSEMLCGLLCFAVMLVPYILFDYAQPYWFAVFIFCAHNVDFRKIVKVFVLASAVLFAIIFICGSTGVIEDVLAYRDDGTVRHAFGFHYTTWPPTHLFFLSICWAWLRQEKITYAEIALIGGFAAFSYIGCNARTSFISLSLLFFFLLWAKLRARKTENLRYRMTKPLQIGCVLSYPLIALVMMLLSVFYSEQNGLLSAINRITNNRLILGHTGFSRYGILPFGQAIEMNTEPPKEYFFLDCSYINILLRYGLLPFLVVMFICVYACCRECEKKRYIRLGLLAIMAIKISMEYHIMEIDHTPILLYLLAFDPDDGEGFNLRAAFPKRKKAVETPPETT